MSRVPVHSVESAPDAPRLMLAKMSAGAGRGGEILNRPAQLAHSPAVLVDSFVRHAGTELDVPTLSIPAGA